jgi:hypothetical protein
MLIESGWLVGCAAVKLLQCYLNMLLSCDGATFTIGPCVSLGETSCICIPLPHSAITTSKHSHTSLPSIHATSGGARAVLHTSSSRLYVRRGDLFKRLHHAGDAHGRAPIFRPVITFLPSRHRNKVDRFINRRGIIGLVGFVV